MRLSSISRLLHRVVAALLALSMALPAYALSVVPRSFDELVSLADLVIVATVSAQESRFDTPQHEHISTYITLGDLQVVKGTVSEAQYTLRIAGGVVGDRAEVYLGLPQLRTGQRYVLFVRGNRRDFFPVVGIHQGIYQVATDAAGRDVVLPLPSDAHGAAAQVAPTSETLEVFLARVRARLGETPQ